MNESVYFKIWDDFTNPNLVVPRILARRDEDGSGIQIALDPQDRAGVIIEVFQGKLLIHFWDGGEHSMLYGDDPAQTIVVTENYDGWRKELESDDE